MHICANYADLAKYAYHVNHASTANYVFNPGQIRAKLRPNIRQSRPNCGQISYNPSQVSGSSGQK